MRVAKEVPEYMKKWRERWCPSCVNQESRFCRTCFHRPGIGKPSFYAKRKENE